MASFFIVVTIFICHAGGNFLHAEKCFVEVGHAEVIVGVNRDMPNFSKHKLSSLGCLDSFQSSRVLSTACAKRDFEFRVEPETRDGQLVSVIHGRRKTTTLCRRRGEPGGVKAQR